MRIAAIYEGTNGIQAIDLVQRKLGLSQAANWAALRKFADIATPARSPNVKANAPAFGHMAERLTGRGRCARKGDVMDCRSRQQRSARDFFLALAGATPYLQLSGLARGGGGFSQARLALAAQQLAEDDPTGVISPASPRLALSPNILCGRGRARASRSPSPRDRPGPKRRTQAHGGAQRMSDQVAIARDGAVLTAAFTAEKKNAMTGDVRGARRRLRGGRGRPRGRRHPVRTARAASSPPATTSAIFLFAAQGEDEFPALVHPHARASTCRWSPLSPGSRSASARRCFCIATSSMPRPPPGSACLCRSRPCAGSRLFAACAAARRPAGRPTAAARRDLTPKSMRFGLVNAVLPTDETAPMRWMGARRRSPPSRARPGRRRAGFCAAKRDAILARMAEETHAFSAALKSPEAHAAFQAFLAGGRESGRSFHCKLRRSDPEPRVRAFIPGIPTPCLPRSTRSRRINCMAFPTNPNRPRRIPQNR